MSHTIDVENIDGDVGDIRLRWCSVIGSDDLQIVLSNVLSIDWRFGTRVAHANCAGGGVDFECVVGICFLHFQHLKCN